MHLPGGDRYRCVCVCECVCVFVIPVAMPRPKAVDGFNVRSSQSRNVRATYVAVGSFVTAQSRVREYIPFSRTLALQSFNPSAETALQPQIRCFEGLSAQEPSFFGGSYLFVRSRRQMFHSIRNRLSRGARRGRLDGGAVLCAFRRVKDHHTLLYDSSLLKNTCVRQVDMWFPPDESRGADRIYRERDIIH